MPSERRTRIGAHQPSAKLSKRQFAVGENAVETVHLGAVNSSEISGQDVLEYLNTVPPAVSKKVKQQLKHEAFVDRVKSSTTPYSKAQRRRFNKKQREQLGGGLSSIEAAISALEEKELSGPSLEEGARSDTAPSQHPSRAKAGFRLISEGKGAPLTKTQRKRALEMEKLRHPRILTNPQYTANPFQTIRTHAQNTLETRPTPG